MKPSTSGLVTRCTELDKCTKDAAVNSKNTLCTKWGIVTDYFDMNFLNQSSAEWNHFKAVSRLMVNRAVARCEVVKHTACREGSSGSGGLDCAVKKAVTCREICTYQGKTDDAFEKEDTAMGSDAGMFKNCNASLCVPPYGAMACARIATMA